MVFLQTDQIIHLLAFEASIGDEAPGKHFVKIIQEVWQEEIDMCL